MNIWLDDEESIEICAMAPYADEKDLAEQERRLAVYRWELSVREAWNRRNPWTI